MFVLRHCFALLLPLLLSAQLAAQDSTVVDIITGSDDLNTLEAAVLAADLSTTLSGEGPFTIFAPTDAAFAALPGGVLEFLLDEDNRDSLASILTYHVIGDSLGSADLEDGSFSATLNDGNSVFVRNTDDGVTINGVRVTMADINADNGVVHLIDQVLMMPPPTVVDVITNDTTLTTLETAVTEAGLVEALSGDGPFTVFAPIDSAFTALDEGVLEALLADPTGDLANILQYHVVAGRFLSTDLTEDMMLTTLQGEDLTISLDGGATVNGIDLVKTDLMADNGVVHVIAGVLMPTATATREPAFAAEVSIAPNPAGGYTTVSLPASIVGETDLTLPDMTGRTLSRLRATDVRQRIELSDLPPGTYLLEVRAEAGAIQRRIVVR